MPESQLYLEPNAINDFYVQIYNLDPKETVNIPSKPNNVNPKSNKFTFKAFTVNDIQNTWRKLKNHESKSLDPLGLNNNTIKYAMNSIQFVKALTRTFNYFSDSGIVPECLKMARIVPVPKVKNATSPNQTRPISIQAVITKILDKCIFKQPSEYFEGNKLFTNSQFGFRKKLTTSHALIALTDYIYEKLDDNHVCAVIALDLQKA